LLLGRDRGAGYVQRLGARFRDVHVEVCRQAVARELNGDLVVLAPDVDVEVAAQNVLREGHPHRVVRLAGRERVGKGGHPFD